DFTGIRALEAWRLRMSRSACKKATDGCGEPRIATSENLAVRGERERLSLPIGHAATGARDDRHQGRIVVGLEASLDDDVDETRRKQTVGVAVAAEARELHRPLEGLEGIGVAALEHVG